jgi:hypothetical protein
VLFDNTDRLGEVVVHEYLHQLDHRFKEASPTDAFLRFKQPNTPGGFMNPDDMSAPPGQQLAKLLNTVFSEPKEYYKAILKSYVGVDNKIYAVDYSLLAKIKRGTWSQS